MGIPKVHISNSSSLLSSFSEETSWLANILFKILKNIPIFTEELLHELSFAELKSWEGICAMNYILPSYSNVTLKEKKQFLNLFF